MDGKDGVLGELSTYKIYMYNQRIALLNVKDDSLEGLYDNSTHTFFNTR